MQITVMSDKIELKLVKLMEYFLVEAFPLINWIQQSGVFVHTDAYGYAYE